MLFLFLLPFVQMVGFIWCFSVVYTALNLGVQERVIGRLLNFRYTQNIMHQFIRSIGVLLLHIAVQSTPWRVP